MKEEKPYWQKLQSPRWQKKRLEILDRDNWACCICQETEKQLQVHHKTYKSGSEIWDYDDGELITLCSDCHYRVTMVGKEIKSMLSFEPHLCAFEQLAELLKMDSWAHFCDMMAMVHKNPERVLEINKMLSEKGGSNAV